VRPVTGRNAHDLFGYDLLPKRLAIARREVVGREMDLHGSPALWAREAEFTMFWRYANPRCAQGKVWPLWVAGKLRPFTYEQFPVTEAAEAHRLMESSRNIRKISLFP
jgi:NADPH:quinone reductase